MVFSPHRLSGKKFPEHPARAIIDVSTRDRISPELVYAATHAHLRGDRGQGIEVQVTLTPKVGAHTMLDAIYKGSGVFDPLGLEAVELREILREERQHLTASGA